MKVLEQADVLDVSGGGIGTIIGKIIYTIGSADAAFYGQIPPGTVLF